MLLQVFALSKSTYLVLFNNFFRMKLINLISKLSVAEMYLKIRLVSTFAFDLVDGIAQNVSGMQYDVYAM